MLRSCARDRMRCSRRKTYILVHQTGLADTAVAKDDDLVFLSVLSILFLRFGPRTFSRIFLREAILVLIVEVAVVAEAGDLAMRRCEWANGRRLWFQG